VTAAADDELPMFCAGVPRGPVRTINASNKIRTAAFGRPFRISPAETDIRVSRVYGWVGVSRIKIIVINMGIFMVHVSLLRA